MHRVHHSVFPKETNKNFGFNLPWWDRFMGTYKAQPRLGHEGMIIGLNQFRDPSKLNLLWNVCVQRTLRHIKAKNKVDLAMDLV